MSWWLWILIILIAPVVMILLSLLFLPFRLEFDSRFRRFAISLFPLVIGSFRLEGIEVIPELRLLGLKLPIPVFDREKSKEKVERFDKDSSERSKSRKTGSRIPFRRSIVFRAIAAIRTLEVREFHLDMDTGDFYNNALLVPVLQPFNGPRSLACVNFEGRVEFRFTIQYRISRMIWAFLFKHKTALQWR